jgi:DNA-binding CsgD family transcriptional regulator
LVLTTYDALFEIVGHTEFFSALMAQLPDPLDRKLVLLVGAALGGIALVIGGKFFSARLTAMTTAGAILFCGGFAGCVMALREAAVPWLGTTAFLILGAGFVFAKFYALHVLYLVGDFTFAALCVAISQCVKTVTVSLSLTVSPTSQFFIGCMLVLTGIGALALLRHRTRSLKRLDVWNLWESGTRSSKAQDMLRALLATALLATVQVFTPVGRYDSNFALGPLAHPLAGLSVIALTWAIMARPESSDMKRLKSAFSVLFCALLFIALQSANTWTVSMNVTEFMLVVLEGFGHVVFWGSILALCWTFGNDNDLRLLGSFLVLYVVISVVWLTVLAKMTDLVLIVVLGLLYVAMLASSRLFPNTVTASEIRVVDPSLLDSIGSAHGLTPREREVLELVVQGRSRSFIMEALSISDGTAKNHISHIYRKLGVANKQELITGINSGSLIQRQRTCD